MALVNSRTAVQHHIPQEAPKSGWLRRAYDAVREAVSGPQVASQGRPQGADSYSAAGRRDINAPRSLNKLCSTGKGGGNTKVLTAISNEYYLQLCDEIGRYSETPAPAARPAAPATRRA